MNRRTYLLGLTAVTGSGASVLGTGAFSNAQLNRQVSIKVVPDDQAVMSLSVRYSGDTVRVENDELIIDTAGKDGDGGITAGSTRKFGKWNNSGKVVKPAIVIENKGSQAQDVEFKYSWNSDTIGESSMEWFLSWRATGQNKESFVVDNTREEASITAQNVGSGISIDIAFRVDAAKAGDELSGEISLESTAVDDEQSPPGNSEK